MNASRHCVIDIEASGFDRHSDPIEVGFVHFQTVVFHLFFQNFNTGIIFRNLQIGT